MYLLEMRSEMGNDCMENMADKEEVVGAQFLLDQIVEKAIQIALPKYGGAVLRCGGGNREVTGGDGCVAQILDTHYADTRESGFGGQRARSGYVRVQRQSTEIQHHEHLMQ